MQIESNLQPGQESYRIVLPKQRQWLLWLDFTSNFIYALNKWGVSIFNCHNKQYIYWNWPKEHTAKLFIRQGVTKTKQNKNGECREAGKTKN